MGCCDERQLWLLYDGRLSRSEEEALRSHVARCDACGARWKDVVALGGDIQSLGPDHEQAARLAQQVVARHIRRRRLVRMSAVGALAAGVVAALVLASALLPDTGSAPPGGYRERPVVQRNGTATGERGKQPARGPEPTDDRLRTEEDEINERDALVFAWGRITGLSERKSFSVVRDTSREFLAEMTGGAARFEVTPRAGAHVRVRTPDALVEVVGTVFTVRVTGPEGQEQTEVDVERGKVRISVNGRTTIVRAGGSYPATVAADAPASPDPVVPKPTFDVPGEQHQHPNSGRSYDMPEGK